MAKSSFWLKGAKGKFAGATIYDANGQSVMREVKSHIKNPRTKAQMVQRVISKTVMMQYAAMKSIANHSFQGVTAGAKSMAHFASINNRATRSFVAELQEAGISLAEVFNFVPCKSIRFIPARAIISDGTLPQIYTNIATDGSAASINAAGIENTYQGVIAALGLQRGDQLTFLTSEKNSNGNYNFNVCRVILDPRKADGTPAPLTTAFIENGAIKNPSFRNEGSFTTLTFDTTVKFAIEGGTVVTAGVIASRQSESDWLRSPCELAFNEESLGDDICSLEEAITRSIEKTPVYTDAERYLNNAGVGGPQAGDAPQSFKVAVNGGPFINVVAGEMLSLTGEVQNITIIEYPEGRSLSAWLENQKLGDFTGSYEYTLEEPDSPIVIKDGDTVILTIGI